MRLRGSRLELVERQLERSLDVPADAQAPCLGVDAGDVEVDQEVVEPERRDRVAEGLERQPVVAGRQLQLLERDSGERVDARNSTTLR